MKLNEEPNFSYEIQNQDEFITLIVEPLENSIIFYTEDGQLPMIHFERTKNFNRKYELRYSGATTIKMVAFKNCLQESRCVTINVYPNGVKLPDDSVIKPILRIDESERNDESLQFDSRHSISRIDINTYNPLAD